MPERISIATAVEKGREQVTPWFLAGAINALTWATARLYAMNQLALILGLLASAALAVWLLVYWYRRSDEWRREVGAASMLVLGCWGAFLALKPDGYVARYRKNESTATTYYGLRDSLGKNPPAAPETVRVYRTRPGIEPPPADPLTPVAGKWPIRYQPQADGFRTFEVPSYAGTIDNLPNTLAWYEFPDGYRMLVEDVPTNQQSTQRDGGNLITTVWGKYADYRHKSGTTSITVLRIRNQPDKPKAK